MKDGVWPIAFYELLDGLGGVEEAGGRRGCEGEGVRAGSDGVALGLCLRGHAGRGRRGMREHDGEGTGRRDGAGSQRLGEVLCGELVFVIGGAGAAGDVNALRDGPGRGRRLHLTRCGEYVDGGALRAGKRGTERQASEGHSGHAAESQHAFQSK